MASPSRNNILLPIGVMLTIITVAGASWYISRDRGFIFGDVGPTLPGAPLPEEAEADSTSNTIDAMRGQMEIVEQTVKEKIGETLESSQALQDEIKRLTQERELEQTTLKERTEREIEEQKSRNTELGQKLDELTEALLARVKDVESRILNQEETSLQIPIDGEAEDKKRWSSGDRIPVTELNDIVWLASMDDSVASRDVSGGSGNSVGERIAEGASRLRTGSGLLKSSNSAATGGVDGEQGSLIGKTNPNVRSNLIEAERRARQLAEDERTQSIVDLEPETELVYTLPDLSIGFDSSALTALVGRVYLDEDKITNPYEFKIVLGRDNVAANGHDLPAEIEGMFFEGWAQGDRLLSCVRGYITAASFLFTDGTVVPAYIGDPGSRPENDAYPDNRIGYITDPRGNCVPGQFLSDAPKWLAANAILAGAEGYARALRQQEIETASIIDGSGVTVIENFAGDAGRFAGASAAVGGIDAVNEYARERLNEIFEAVYVPPGHPVVVHLQQELRLDRKVDARKITYPSKGGQSNAYLD